MICKSTPAKRKTVNPLTPKQDHFCFLPESTVFQISSILFQVCVCISVLGLDLDCEAYQFTVYHTACSEYMPKNIASILNGISGVISSLCLFVYVYLYCILLSITNCLSCILICLCCLNEYVDIDLSCLCTLYANSASFELSFMKIICYSHTQYLSSQDIYILG